MDGISVKELIATVKEAVEDEDDVNVAVDKAQEALDNFVSIKRRKGIHFKAEAQPSVRQGLEVVLRVGEKKTVVEVPL